MPDPRRILISEICKHWLDANKNEVVLSKSDARDYVRIKADGRSLHIDVPQNLK